MNQLFLADLNNLTADEVARHIADNYAGKVSGFDYGNPTEAEKQAVLDDLQRFDILIAYESVGSWGCESASYFLLKEKATGDLFDFSGGHCSCYGFEGQYEPTPTNLAYLQSDKFYLSTGGYDDYEKENKAAVIAYLRGLAP